MSRDADGCKVLSGVLDPDPYTGTRISFERGRSKVDIDHLVALSDAWQKGAQKWSDGKRRAFANDPLNLVAADSSTNRRKGTVTPRPGCLRTRTTAARTSRGRSR